ncbi:hypothetical protein NLG97_g8038 [Lecanicillium saksenae]|uniref:Uncharacterized protein n=1 Tax=Lecanicillium saksenae TaxID=468837 RepID=A0ACC1QMM3_9HYPO|nr:hypothetical protein NLG97_g8038 [Lecanicillium saksenae]
MTRSKLDNSRDVPSPAAPSPAAPSPAAPSPAAPSPESREDASSQLETWYKSPNSPPEHETSTETTGSVDGDSQNDKRRRKLGAVTLNIGKNETERIQVPGLASLGRVYLRYETEVIAERRRIKFFRKRNLRCSAESRELLAAMKPKHKKALAHHFVRRRWEEIGIWNDTWKFENPSKSIWKWNWETRRLLDSDGNLPFTGGAFKECLNLDPGEYANSVKSRAQNQIPNGQWTGENGNDFISSRPWFAFEIERRVERTRRARSDDAATGVDTDIFVRDRWIEAGLWNAKWDTVTGAQNQFLVGWRWDHEDSEPQWADFQDLERRDGLANIAATLGFPLPTLETMPTSGPSAEDGSASELSFSVFEDETEAQAGTLMSVAADTGSAVTTAEEERGSTAQDEANQGTQRETEGSGANLVKDEDKENIEPPPVLRRSKRIANMKAQSAMRDAEAAEAAEAAQVAQQNQPASRAAPRRRRRQPVDDLPSSGKPARGGKRRVLADITEDIAAANPPKAPAKKRRRRG